MSTVQGPALPALFDSLLTKLSSSEFLEFATEKQACRMELKKWEEMLRDIQPLLNDAGEKQWKDRSVKAWLAELQLLAYDMDDILDVFATRSLERKVMQKQQAGTSKVQKFVSAVFTTFIPNIVMVSKTEKISRKLEDLAGKKSELPLEETHSLGSTTLIEARPEFFPVVDECEVYGRDADRAKIVELLLTNNIDDDRVAVVPIVGKEGIGKTALAQLVYNDVKVNNYFDLKI